jgi:hypothetical protein
MAFWDISTILSRIPGFAVNFALTMIMASPPPEDLAAGLPGVFSASARQGAASLYLSRHYT